MLSIRFNRVGKKNKAQFKIALQEHTVAPGGRHVEILGSYNPHSKEVVLKEDRIKYWLGKGAKPSDTVHNLLVSKGIIERAKKKVKLPAKKVEETAASAPAPESQGQKEEAKPEEVKTEEAKTEGAKVEEVKPEVKEAKVEVAPVAEEKAASASAPASQGKAE